MDTNEPKKINLTQIIQHCIFVLANIEAPIKCKGTVIDPIEQVINNLNVACNISDSMMKRIQELTTPPTEEPKTDEEVKADPIEIVEVSLDPEQEN